jgi:hypothetical protein
LHSHFALIVESVETGEVQKVLCDVLWKHGLWVFIEVANFLFEVVVFNQNLQVMNQVLVRGEELSVDEFVDVRTDVLLWHVNDEALRQ